MKENNDGNDTNVGSMENSIKETIKIIERKIKEAEHYTDITGLCLTLDKELCNAFINILSDYKRVLEINEVLLKENEQLKNDIENMYDEEIVISIIEDNFNLCRNEVLEVLGSEK